MNSQARYLVLVLGTLLVALLVAFVGATDVLGEGASSVRSIVGYIAISGSVALCLGLISVAVGMRYLPRLSMQIAVAYAVGSLGAIATVAYAPLLMFKDPGDLHLLMLLLVCFMVISVGLGAIIAFGVAQHLNTLREAARRVAAGQFDTRVDVPSGDELSELAAAFNRMSQELGISFEAQRAMQESRRDLIVAISHDLRTPLSSIRAMLEAIEDGVVTDVATVAQYHHAMRDQVSRLSRLIDDLFELSRLDSGMPQLRPAQVDLNELVSETVESLRPSAERGAVNLQLKQEHKELLTSVDADGLQRVVANLLDNAIRHTPEGGTIAVGVHDTNGECEVEVVDSGEGIASTDIDHVFERFYRGEKARTRTGDAGAGLGLAIAKAIVEAHNGRIWAENSAGGGARFVFTLPQR